MVQFNQISNSVVRDNIVSLNNQLTYKLTDDEVSKIKSILDAMTSGTVQTTKPVSTTLNVEPDKWEKAPIVGTKMYQSDFITVTEVEDNGNKQYRVYLDCPIQGEKGDKVRYALKKQVKDFEGKFAGNFKLRQIYWAFPNKTKANAYIKARKEADKAYQQSKQA